MKALMVILSSCLLLGCSALSGRREVPQEKKAPKMVPQQQYDQLLEKYEALIKSQKPEQPDQSVKGQNLEAIAKDLENSGLDLSSSGKVELAETVDVFGDKGVVKSKEVVAAPVRQNYDDSSINGEIGQLIQARELVYQNQHEAAMNLLVNLENSSSRQIQVRAKYLIGEVLYNQGSYDVAMQTFEGIIQNYAFSGVVLHALTKLVACTHQLKLSDKYQQYYSILHDFFQST